MEVIFKSKYTSKLIGNTAFMLLNKPIGQSTDTEQAISGSDFANEAYTWKGQGKDITVKINSMGGIVGDGWDMVDSIIETRAKTENVGFAYSMAGICLIVGADRTAYPHSRAMIHAPRRMDGNKTFHTELIKDQFRTILKNHTKFTESEINEMIDSGKDYFFDANQMLEKGMIDRIMPTGAGVVMNSLNDEEAYLYYNSLLEEKTNNNMDLSKVWAKLTGKDNEAEHIVAVTEMKAENASLKADKAKYETDLAAAKAEIETLKAEKSKSDSKSKATELIEGAVRAGKLNGIKAEDKAKWIENATANYEVVKSMIDSMPSGKITAAATIPGDKGIGGEMTYEWLAKHNPQELNRIAESDPTLFNKLSDEYNEKQKAAK